VRLGSRDQGIPQAVRPPKGRAGIPAGPGLRKCAGECLREPESGGDEGGPGLVDSISRHARLFLRGVAGSSPLKG
jgi:hypothetical protein